VSMTKTKDATGVYRNLENQFSKVFKNILRDKKDSKDMSTRTLFRYKSSFNMFMHFLSERYRLRQLGAMRDKFVAEFIEWRKEQEISPGTIKRDIVAIQFFHRMDEKSQNRLRPLEQYDFGKIEKRYIDRAWTNKEFEGMCRKAEELGRMDVLLPMRIARFAGLRIHECIRLGTVQTARFLKEGELTTKGKGGKVRTIPLNRDAQVVLAEAIAAAGGRGKVFVPEGKAAAQVIKAIDGFIRRHRDKVMGHDREAPITYHGLRHRYAQEERVSGKSLKQVSRQLGHEREEITRVYIGPNR
jgi:site-specific recombinase XerD